MYAKKQSKQEILEKTKVFSLGIHTVVAIFAGGNRAVYGISEKL